MNNERRKKLTIKREQIAKRRADVWAMRMTGMSYRAIAKALGVGLGTVEKDIHAVCQEFKRQTLESVEIIIARLERAMAILYERVREGDLQAIGEWRKLNVEVSKLRGLYPREGVGMTIGVKGDEVVTLEFDSLRKVDEKRNGEVGVEKDGEQG